jgi:hypothetical protein
MKWISKVKTLFILSRSITAKLEQSVREKSLSAYFWNICHAFFSSSEVMFKTVVKFLS